MHFVAMADARDASAFDDDHVIEQLFLRREDAACIDCGSRHSPSMLLEVRRKISAQPCILFLVRYNHGAQLIGRNWMSYDKRYVAQKRQRRRRKTAKAKVKLYEQGKLPHDKLPALAKKFLSRKNRALKKAE